ncbi:DNA gyrase subunit A [Coxiella endosymbiont of Amblyomma sculptum]|uniref:DNA gyrase subunit A n=1 Tax=Coxiella endosymbiont of Amblyomma sculptum TaxID=2487929 RepID=UPI00132E8EC2|nr:DNA gyrase subunit A [Coxiella endosymbiont of Amblyomma sculptum]QHG92635.1 DNA gyrase subunit A [Coxiella endosymbiont of Amblyomma sculptum]
MTEFAHEIVPIPIENELKQSYLGYAMSVIVGRALPDVRDGLKPVHRRILYAMHALRNDWDKAYKKSARIVGDVIGKYHPHGDVAVYDAIVRMAQDFSLRYLLIDGQGNFGSVDGDAPAAMRYTEIRLSRFAHTLMQDIDKETVDCIFNYDETETMPLVLPTRVPNLLINGSSGIAVGMATNIPPHNLSEIIDATLVLIDNSDLTVEELMHYIPGPDFPTLGIINGRSGIVEAYKTGRGRIYVRAKADIEITKNGRSQIIVSELPYQVNKARLLEKIKKLVYEKKIEGISALRDESDKCGMRIMIEITRGNHAGVVLNNLYAQTQLETVFGINMVALRENGQPCVLNLKKLLNAFLQHRREVVMRRTLFELHKARSKAHILEGFGIALTNIDEVIVAIKKAQTRKLSEGNLLEKVWKVKESDLLQKFGNDRVRPENLDSKYGLKTDGYHLSLSQVQAILDLQLHRLTGLESKKIREEYVSLSNRIDTLTSIISDSDKLHEVIREELIEIKTQFGDARRTKILHTKSNLEDKDLIPKGYLIIILSCSGYIKSQSINTYRAQHRGGRGKIATAVKNQDSVGNILVANSHETILCFSTYGKVYELKVHQIPQSNRISYGFPIVNLLPLDKDEYISAMLPTYHCNKDLFVFMTTTKGFVKKVVLSKFLQPRVSGKIALTLKKGDRLVGVDITDGKKEVMLVTNAGKAIRFHEREVRVMGRAARGVCGIKLKGDNQNVISLVVVREKSCLLTATAHGYGQRTIVKNYRSTSRGGQGVIAIRVSRRNGNAVSAVQVVSSDEAFLISKKGILVRIRTDEIPQMGRSTQGVRLIGLAQEDTLAGMEIVEKE